MSNEAQQTETPAKRPPRPPIHKPTSLHDAACAVVNAARGWGPERLIIVDRELVNDLRDACFREEDRKRQEARGDLNGRREYSPRQGNRHRKLGL